MRRPITRKEFNKLTQFAKDAMKLASTHDPDHAHEIKRIWKSLVDQFNWLLEVNGRLSVIDRQLERLGAPQYRTVRKGKGKR